MKTLAGPASKGDGPLRDGVDKFAPKVRTKSPLGGT